MEVTPNYNRGSQSIMVCCNPGSLVVADVQKYMKNTVGKKAELQFSTVSLNVNNSLNELIEVTFSLCQLSISRKCSNLTISALDTIGKNLNRIIWLGILDSNLKEKIIFWMDMLSTVESNQRTMALVSFEYIDVYHEMGDF